MCHLQPVFPSGSVASEPDVSIEQAYHEDRIDIIALPVAFLDTVGIDARGIIGAAPEEILLPVVLNLDNEVPAQSVTAAEVQP